MGQNLISLLVGDPYADGHGRTERKIVKSSLDVGELQQAYTAGVGIVGFDLDKQVATGYDDYTIAAELVEKLEAQGFDRFEQLRSGIHEWDAEPSSDDESGDWNLSIDAYVDLYLFIVKLGRPDAKLELLQLPSVALGGYGLFVL